MKIACVWFTTPASLTPGLVNQFAESCLKFSPQISIRKTEAVFIEIGKSRNLYTVEGFLMRIQVLIRRYALSANVGLGLDVTDAVLRAQYNQHDVDALPLVALHDFVDPFNKDIVIHKYISKMIESFTDLGVKTIAGFKKVPTSDLISRFGPVAHLAKQRIHFETPVTWTYWKPVETISIKTDFPYFEFYGELEPILFELKKQLDHVFQRLWARGDKAQKMRVTIFFEKNSFSPKPYRKFDFEFQFPQSTTKATLNIIKERLSRDFTKNPIRTPLQGLETTVTESAKGYLGQKNLLHNHEEVAEQKNALLSQLTETHGTENIFHAELVEDRRPEKSWTKLKPESAHLNAKKSSAPNVKNIPLRPTHLLKPERIEITAGFVHIRRKPHKIVNWLSGVEKISGGWQDDPRSLNLSYDRNYYNIELDSGVTISIFQTPDLKYYLHGFFG